MITFLELVVLVLSAVGVFLIIQSLRQGGDR